MMVADEQKTDSFLSGGILGISREAEEQRINDTLSVVRDNLTKYGGEVAKLRAGVKDTQVLDACFLVGEDRKNLVSACDNLCKKG